MYLLVLHILSMERTFVYVLQRSIAEIEWKESRKKNVYRIGHKGKVDLHYKEPGSGGYYYVQHLPVLGTLHISYGHLYCRSMWVHIRYFHHILCNDEIAPICPV